MNGASTDPWANTSSVPTNSMTTTTGSSHHSLRTRINAHSCPAKLNLLTVTILELMLHVGATLRPGFPPDPEARPGRALERVAAEEAHHESDRRQHDEVHDAHEDGRRDLRQPRGQP